MIRCCRTLVALALLVASHASAQDIDLVLENGTIYDGAGGEPVVGHVAIKGGKIVSVGTDAVPSAKWRIDVKGLVVAPGFIDLHTHSDGENTEPESRACVNYIMQGCTTSVTGNCGSGPVDVAGYYKDINSAGCGTNVAHLLPQGNLRLKVVGDIDRQATDEELEQMRSLARKAMQDGAWGMSTGLIYTPSTYASTEELIELTKCIAEGQGIYVSHIRSEGDQLLEAVQEAIRIGKEGGTPTHISHFKASGTANWGRLRVAIDLIEKSRATGQTVTADQYPYTASSTSLEATVFPLWSRNGGQKELVKRLDDPETKERLLKEVGRAIEERDDGARLLIASFSKRADWAGKNLKEIAVSEQKTPLEIAELITRQGGAAVINFGMHEDDVRLAMNVSWVATASDGGTRVPNESVPHPRSYGTFPRKIGLYSIRENVLPLSMAIRSSSGLPADILGMTDRGYLKSGQFADVVIFDPQAFIDTATFAQPHQYAAGMKYVFVNGTPAVYNGVPTGALAGRALRKNGGK
ncbi:amidohydrolase family protein [bacterium]|nr:amidohydrolase family protein [bacterium]